jgi:signal transduction histidine kinase/ActR/RegA family two-component response regulator
MGEQFRPCGFLERFMDSAVHSLRIRGVTALRWRLADGRWRLEEIDHRIAELMGRGPGELPAEEGFWRTVWGGVDVFAAVEAADRSQAAIDLRHQLRRPDGGLRCVLNRIDIERDAEGRAVGFASTLIDVTEAAAPAAGVDMVAYLGHEVRTPLTGMLGLAEALSRSSLTPQQKRLAQALSEAGTSLLHLVNNMLALSRMRADADPPAEVEFRLGALCEQVADLFAPCAAAQGSRLTISGQPMDIALTGDAHKLRQVLSNLVMNAVKFAQGAEIRILWRADPVGRGDALTARVTVSDSGPGMDAATVARLFRPFRQGEAGLAAGGAGLGLAISRALVERMGGSIRCESAPGAGAAFIVEVPLRAARSAEDSVGDLDLLRRRIASMAPRLLVAEDCEANRRLLSVLLEPLNVRIRFVGGGAEAVGAAFPPRFDAVMMDRRMPGMDGLAATAEIRRLERRHGGAHTPIIGLSADSEAAAEAAFRAAGADAYVAKPFTTRQLLGALDRVLRAARPETLATGT